MILDKIITTTSADPWNRLRFLAMERSLRAVGSDLPLWVIPYNEERFALPSGAHWWEAPDFYQWLKEHNAKLPARKYICLTEQNYQYVDTDIVFLKNPAGTLATCTGFIASDGHWHNPHRHTYTAESLPYLRRKSTTWPKSVFNAGQFACDRVLYPYEELIATCTRPDCVDTFLYFTAVKHEQPGMNLLVNMAGVPVVNLSLPPFNMESTWAGDYEGDDYEGYWLDKDKKPYLLHWAGLKMDVPRPVDDLFYAYLTSAERKTWDAALLQRYAPKKVHRKYGPFQEPVVRLKRVAQILLKGK